MRFCTCPLRVEHLFPKILLLPICKPCSSSKLSILVSHIYVSGPHADLENLVWISNLSFLRKNLFNCDYSPVCESLIWKSSLDYTLSLPSFVCLIVVTMPCIAVDFCTCYFIPKTKHFWKCSIGGSRGGS